MVSLLVLSLMVIFVSAIVLTLVLHLFIFGAPYIPTARSVATAMVKAAKLTGNETVLDLGAGDGVILIEAKKLHPGITAIGYEIVTTVWLFGKAHIWFSGQDVTLLCRNLFKADLSQADVIFVYLMPEMMKKLKEKCDRELKKGAKVISHAFRFADKEPSEIVELPYRGKVKKLFIYQW